MHPVLLCSNDYLVISTLEKTCLVCKLSPDGDLSAEPWIIASKPQSDKDVDIEAKGIVLHVAFSHNGRYLALCNDYKQLLLYSLSPQEKGDSKEWKLLSSRCTAKKGVKIEFVADDSSLVIADKLGAVTRYSVVEPEKEGDVLLGHVSVLVDCKFLDSGRYLATADRDEKIRISCYPQTYDIQAFCLGHTKYVTSLAECGSYLLSGSGDSTVRLWEPLTGRMLSQVTCSGVVQQLLYVPEAKQVLCLLNGQKQLVYLSVDLEKLQISMKHTMELDALPIAMCKYLNHSILLLLDRKDLPLELISVVDGGDDSKIAEVISTVCNELKGRWALLAGAVEHQRNIFADMTKMDLQSIELNDKKRKNEPSSNSPEPKHVK